MPTITLNKKDVLKLIGKTIPDSKLKERIPMLGTDLEAINSREIVVEVFPNRPDMVTEEGFARALSSFLNIKTGLRQYKVNSSNYFFKIDSKVKKVRPAVAAAVIKEVRMDNATIKSIMDMQDKLTLTHGRNRKKVAIGIHNLDAITFPLFYTTKPPSYQFTPLEANRPYALSEILKKHPKGKEFGGIIEHFKEYPLWIDKKNQVLSMPPIINSEETKLAPSTKNLFIDITGTDQLAVEQALNIIVTSLADRGGKIFKVNSFPHLQSKRIKISRDYINKILGLSLSQQQMKKLLEKMGLTMQGSSVLYPAYRADILHQIDLAEDIAIAYGYENFTPQIPNIATIAEENPFETFKKKCADILVGLNIMEASTYHLISRETLANYKDNNKAIGIMNPKSAEYDSLRTSLIPPLLEVLKSNRNHEYHQRIFEIGSVFNADKFEESSRLSVLISHSHADFTEIKQIFEALFSSLGIACAIEEASHPSFVPGRVAEVSCKKKPVAHIGELHPDVLENFKLEMPAVALEINLKELYRIACSQD